MERTLTWYHLALFLHLCALLAAIGASTLSHYAEVRIGKARTAGEMLGWATLLGRLGRVFPIALLTLVATGAYMVSALWTWRTGWVDAAVGGVIALFVGGVFLGAQTAALQRALAGAQDTPINTQAQRLAGSVLTHSVSHGNTALAIGVVFIMVSKPDLLGSILSLLVAYAIGVALAVMLGRNRSAHAAKSQWEEAGAI